MTAFPGENPSELELVRWLELAKDRLRVLKLLPYALSADPPVPTEYAEKTAKLIKCIYVRKKFKFTAVTHIAALIEVTR